MIIAKSEGYVARLLIIILTFAFNRSIQRFIVEEKNFTYQILNTIDSPADLRKLRVEQLPLVCSEIRHRIIEVLAEHPGHLASSLGAVEITVALHYVYQTPDDRIVWDVGQQSY